MPQPLDPLLAGAYHLHGVAHQLRRRGEAGPLRGHERVALDGAADCAEIASHAVLLAHEAIRQSEARAARRAALWAAGAAVVGGLVGGAVVALVVR